jgi:hypothetical protein
MVTLSVVPLGLPALGLAPPRLDIFGLPVRGLIFEGVIKFFSITLFMIGKFRIFPLAAGGRVF